MERTKRQRTEKYATVGGGVGVRETVEETIRIGKKEMRYGVVASGGTPFWNWVVPTGGILCWSWDSKRAGIRNEETAVMTPVDVVLFDGPGPRATSDFWKVATTNCLAWINGCSRCKPPALDRHSWSLERVRVNHSELGGVTTLCSTFTIAERLHHQEISPSTLTAGAFTVPPHHPPLRVQPGLANSSCFRVINPVTPGQPCSAPGFGEYDLATSLLRWNDRDLKFKLPSVFNKSTGFVRRRLTDKEVLTAMDVPAAVLKAASTVEQQGWRKELTVPFKSRFAILRALGKRATDRGPPDASAVVDSTGEATNKNRSCQSGGVLVSARAEQIPHPETNEGSGGASRSTIRKSLTATATSVATDALPEVSLLLKATRSDGAEVAAWMWDSRCRAGCPGLEAVAVQKGLDNAEIALAWSAFLTTVRIWMLHRWKRLVSSGFWSWWKTSKFGSGGQESASKIRDSPTIAAGLAALHHSVDASWWDWDRGSAPFFWRFPPDWLILTRDGLRPRFISEVPKYTRAQKVPSDPGVRSLERGKLTTVRERGYLQPRADIVGLLNFFSVPKGDSDVRMVYDGTKSGLNDSLYAPWFSLTTLDCMLRAVVPGTFSADNDYGEMFLNFWLHPDLRRYCGIDLTKLFPEEVPDPPGCNRLWESWTRCAMGLKPSPYQSVQTGLQLKQLAMGDRHDSKNVFRWTRVRLNLPGDPTYDPTMPWVSRVREDGFTVAADVLQFVDDLRVTGPSEEETWKASSQMAKGAAYRGCQDAARKRRPPALSPGAWAGSVVESTPGSVFKRVSLERWTKTQRCLNQVSDWMNANPSALPRKKLEQVRGFLVYVSSTYSILTPYLRGIHLTLDSWRPNRDSEGWVRRSKDPVDDDHLARSLFSMGETDEAEYPDAPTEVRAVPRLALDLAALHELTSHDEPPNVLVRPVDGMAVVFIYGDASGAGYGISLWKKGAKEIGVEYGEWTKEYSEKSSNHREMYNFTLFLEKKLAQGDFARGTEVFVFTDNQVTESAFYKGTSTSQQLFELVLRLRKLEMIGQMFLRVIWVAGTRMIEQGTDGFSRGDLENGVATGVDMLSYVPLNDTAFGRQQNLEAWLRSSLQGEWLTLDADGWYDIGMQTAGQFIWCPAPAAADAALDQLCEAKHIRPEGSHIFVCPALLTPRWRKKLGKIADFVFCVPVGSRVWSKALGRSNIVPPLWHKSASDCLKCGQKISPTKGIVCANFGHSRGTTQTCKGAWHGQCYQRSNLDKFPVLSPADLEDGLVDPAEIEGAECVDDPSRFQQGRDGDHLMCPFQCDTCVFMNIQKRFPNAARNQDSLLLLCIRRVILDSLWSRERETVKQNCGEVRRYLDSMQLFGVEEPFPPRGPFPVDDSFGYKVACALVWRSMSAGRNSTHVQFNSIRKVRAAMSNYVHTTPGGTGLATIGSGEAGGQMFTSSPTNSLWFRRFLLGCHKRMGDVWIPDRAITIDELHASLRVLEESWNNAALTANERLEVALTGAMLVTGFTAGLRGEEIPQIDLAAMFKHWAEGEEHPRQKHVPLVLVGRFKQTVGEKLYFQPLAQITNSGIRIRTWLGRTLTLYKEAKILTGPMFRSVGRNGAVKKATVGDLDLLLHDILRQVQVRCPDIIPGSVKIEDEYSARRSLRRGSTSEAQNVQVPKEVIEANNRWKKHMRSQGVLPSMDMIERYSDAKASVSALIRYSMML